MTTRIFANISLLLKFQQGKMDKDSSSQRNLRRHDTIMQDEYKYRTGQYEMHRKKEETGRSDSEVSFGPVF